MSLWIPLTRTLPHDYEVIDVQLRNGSIVQHLAIDAAGIILGKVVGGHDGLDQSPLTFKQEEIQAYRFRAGLAARLGLAKWHHFDQYSSTNERDRQR